MDCFKALGFGGNLLHSIKTTLLALRAISSHSCSASLQLQAGVPPTTVQRREGGDLALDQHEIRQPLANIICFFFHFNEHFTKYKIYCLFWGNIRYFFSLRHTVHESRGFCVSSRKKESVRALGRAAPFSPCPERGTDRSKCRWYCW